MNRYIYYFLFIFLTCTSAFAQQGDKLNLLSSFQMRLVDGGKQTFVKLPVIEHKGSTLYADSGYLEKDHIGREFFEAYGNVRITQPNGTEVFSDKLHYEASTQTATLTNSVRMVGTNAILTTNYLVYNMRSNIGNYSGGGRIVTNTDTIISKTATYFENTGDSYFRNKVVVRTPNVKIYTDSMRYNSLQHMTYFYGPTNIKGNKGENLYTEKGRYNTATGQAYFSKNNLYTETTRFLKGDSLYYDRRTGEGKAMHNVVFIDTADKFYAYGGYGNYKSIDGSITMTQKPLIIMAVKKDTTNQNSSLSFSTSTNNTAVNPKKTAEKEKKNNKKELSKTDSSQITTAKTPSEHNTTPKEISPMDSVYLTSDTLFSKIILRSEYIPKNFQLDRNGGTIDIEEEVDYGDDNDSTMVSTDSVQMHPDSTALHKVKTTVKKNPELHKNTVVKKTAPTHTKKVLPKNYDPNKVEITNNLKADSIMRDKAVIPKGHEQTNLMNKAIASVKNPGKDTTTLDTAKTRIIKAFHHVRMYKSDFQAVADSMYYGMVDSMFRLMGKPMMWAEGSQVSGDSIYLQIVNQKLDNTLVVGNAFLVNSTMDSVKFNQIKGRKITSFFSNSKLDRIFVDGNAENIIYNVDEKTNIATELAHDRSSRFKILMKDGKLDEYVSIRKVDGKVYPLALVTNDKEFLPGFIWRPEDRPKSKEDLLNRKRDLSKSSFTAPQPKPEDNENKPGTTSQPKTPKASPKPSGTAPRRLK